MDDLTDFIFLCMHVKKTINHEYYCKDRKEQEE